MTSTRIRQVLLTLAKELREALRDRRTIAVMVLFPLVVYPLLSLMVMQVASSRAKEREARPSSVGLTGQHPSLASHLAAHPERFKVVPGATEADVRAARVDALVEVEAKQGAATRATVVFDAGREESRAAEERLSGTLGELLPPGCAPTFAAERRDVGSKAGLGGYLLAKALPVALLLMVLVGAFYPAVDVTAGERERGTLETLLSAPVRRFDLLLGKVLAVAVIAATTGLLNLASMSLTLGHALRLAAPDLALVIPWGRTLASALVVLPAAFLFAATFVAVGALARGFKEAQNLLMPAYFAFIAPTMVGAIGEQPLTGAVTFVPGMNLTLLARELLLGRARLLPTLATLASTCLFAAVALAFAARVYGSERFVEPRAADKGGRAAPASTPFSSGEALLMYALGFVLLYFAFVPLQQRSATAGLLVGQWVGLFGLVAVAARLTGRKLAPAIAWHRPSVGAMAGAAMIGLSAWAFVATVADKLVPVPPEVLEHLRRTFVPDTDPRALAKTLFIAALTPAICEEVFFRGVLLRGLVSRIGPGAAILLCGLLFGLFHMDVWRLLPTTLLGVVLSWIAWRTGSLVPSVIAHFCNNATLLTLATLGMDRRFEKLGTVATVGLLVASAVLSGAGAVLIGRARRNPLL